MYDYIVLIHLLCGIIFVGFLFTDVVFLSALRATYGKEEAQKIKEVIIKRAIKVVPFAVLILVLSGLFLLTFHWQNMPKLLHLKLVLVGLIVLGILYSLTMRLIIKKPPHAFMKHFHGFALVMAVLIVVVAKLMFLFF